MRAMGWLRWVLMVWTGAAFVVFALLWGKPNTPMATLESAIGTLAYFGATFTYLWLSKPRVEHQTD
jgi:hypothetical protein